MIRSLAAYSPYGSLSQVFVIEAIRYYSEMIIKNGEPVDNKEAIINPKIWYGIAKDINMRLESNYENGK